MVFRSRSYTRLSIRRAGHVAIMCDETQPGTMPHAESTRADAPNPVVGRVECLMWLLQFLFCSELVRGPAVGVTVYLSHVYALSIPTTNALPESRDAWKAKHARGYRFPATSGASRHLQNHNWCVHWCSLLATPAHTKESRKPTSYEKNGQRHKSCSCSRTRQSTIARHSSPQLKAVATLLLQRLKKI